MAKYHFCIFLLNVRLEKSNATRTSVAADGSTEANLYLRLRAQMQTSLATRTISLRPYIHSKDYDDIHNWVTDERMHALWCANLIPYPLSGKNFLNVLEKVAADWRGSAYVAMADDGALLGFFVLSINVIKNSGFLKFVIVNNEFRRKGYGAQMIQLIQKYAFEIAGVSSIHLNVFDVNANARKCYARNGFVEDSCTENAFAFRDEIWGRCHMVVSK